MLSVVKCFDFCWEKKTEILSPAQLIALKNARHDLTTVLRTGLLINTAEHMDLIRMLTRKMKFEQMNKERRIYDVFVFFETSHTNLSLFAFLHMSGFVFLSVCSLSVVFSCFHCVWLCSHLMLPPSLPRPATPVSCFFSHSSRQR